jgi:mono/diheme cytochrome c family protein
MGLSISVALTLPQPSVTASSKAKQRGAELFADRGCAHCHGPNGIGGKRGPDLQKVRKMMTKEQIRVQIHDGGMMMPAFGQSLTAPQIDDLIAYLRAKRKVIVVPTQPHADAMNTQTPQPDTN